MANQIPPIYTPLLDHGYVKYINHMGDDLAPLEAARMSTGNPTGVDAKHDAATRDYLWRHAHATPFEMSVLSVEIQCPIFVARQIFRHRTFSFNEFSGRYATMPDLFYVPSPERVQGQDAANKQGSGGALPDAVVDGFIRMSKNDQTAARNHYEGYMEEGVANELARINLPLSQYTRFRMQGNLRNWLHFLNLRLDAHAQYEARVYAEAVAEIIKQLWPETWAVFEEHTLNARTFSRSEMDLLNSILLSLRSYSPFAVELLRDEANKALGKSRAREFLAKLGLQAD